jgi:predicted ester cyclase
MALPSSLGKESFTALRTAFSDMRVTVDDLIAEGDRVALRWTSHSTHRAELFGIPATNRRVFLPAIRQTGPIAKPHIL